MKTLVATRQSNAEMGHPFPSIWGFLFVNSTRTRNVYNTVSHVLLREHLKNPATLTEDTKHTSYSARIKCR